MVNRSLYQIINQKVVNETQWVIFPKSVNIIWNFFMKKSLLTSLAIGSLVTLNGCSNNPFSAEPMQGGYENNTSTLEKSQEGSCGAHHLKQADGACSANMNMDMGKNMDGGCSANMSMGKTLDGGCSANMSMDKNFEGKCGEGACGASH